MTHKLHTPGPWTAIVTTKACFHRGNRVSIVWGNLDCLCAPEEPDPDGVLLGIPCLCAAQTVAEVWPADDDSDIADGKLIAAAPDLLAAARRVVRNPSNQHALDALAKAIHDAAGPLHCEHCEGSGYVQCDYDETTPCTHCLDGREVAEQEAKNA